MRTKSTVSAIESLKKQKNLRVGTLMRQQRELEDQMRALRTKAVLIEARIRETIGTGYSMVDSSHGHWYQGTVQEEERMILDQKKVAAALGPQKMAKCYSKSTYVKLYVKEIDQKAAIAFREG